MNPSLTEQPASFEIIPVSPRPDISDTPTVADSLPNATAQVLPSNANEKQSYGELWKAWAHTTGFCPEV